jgi:abortive infection bacteriophage resistance protein
MLSLDGFFLGFCPVMQYTKPPLTFDQQADLLIKRGMSGDRDVMVSRLSVVNYYRLSGYWHTFADANGRFASGTSFEEVWNRYVFDRRLRLLVIDAIERIEVAVRARLAYEHAHAYGPFAYAENPATLPKLDPARRATFLAHVKEEAGRSRETFVEHFFTKYGDFHQSLPVWEATEIMAFGTLLTFFNGSPRHVKKAVASQFGMPHEVLGSWLLTLWNRVLGIKPLIPRADQYPDWHVPAEVKNDRLFGVLTLSQYCLQQVAPQSAWPELLSALLAELPGVPIAAMGFPPDWRKSALWR